MVTTFVKKLQGGYCVIDDPIRWRGKVLMSSLEQPLLRTRVVSKQYLKKYHPEVYREAYC